MTKASRGRVERRGADASAASGATPTGILADGLARARRPAHPVTRRVHAPSPRPGRLGRRPAGDRLVLRVLAVEPRVRRRPRRPVLPRRRVPPRQDVDRVRASARSTSSTSTATIYVPFAPFPAIVLDAARRADRARPSRTSGRPGSTRCSRRSWCCCAWWVSGRIGAGEGPRPAGDGAPARLLDADLVGHDPRRRLAHRPPRRDDPHAVPARRDVRPQARRCSWACSSAPRS